MNGSAGSPTLAQSLRLSSLGGNEVRSNLHLFEPQRTRRTQRGIRAVIWNMRISINDLRSTCEHPPDALSLLKENSQQFDLVITDLQMPYLDGIELAAELLKINPALPVVLTSAATLQMPSEKLHCLGIRDFLSKPWDRKQLFSVIRQALASKQSRGEASKN